MSNLMVTDQANFYKVNLADGGTAYMPAEGAEAREAARKADAAGDPPIVSGFAVYDTAVSTTAAVALYATKADAQAHEPAEPTPTPETVFEEPSEAPASAATEKRKTKHKGRAKRN